MKHIVVNQEVMKKLDESTCKLRDISNYELMEIAGKKIYDFIVLTYEINQRSESFTIVAGPGNNGGDGLVVAKHLLENGHTVKVYLVGDVEKRSEANKEASKNIKNIEVLLTIQDITSFTTQLQDTDFIIDALFGLGMTRPITGIFFDVIKAINESNKKVISIDFPSGINSENGLVSGIAIKASETIIIEHYKIGNLLGDSLDYQGKKTLLSIGIETSDEITSYLLERDSLPRIKQRKHNSHKYDYGSVLVIGGSKGMTGAPILSSISALKAGSGLVTMAIEECHFPFVSNPYPELMIQTYETIHDVIALLKKKSVVVFGPGLGKANGTYQSILDYLLTTEIPLVLDADGLDYFKNTSVKALNSQILITPHYGELANLLNVTVENIVNDPLKYVDQASSSLGVQVILKGACTIISDTKNIYFSPLGNPGMATAGSGDVLAGIIASFIGKKHTLLEASLLGVYVHSLAGKYAKEKYGEESLIATDIIHSMYRVLNDLYN